MVSRQFFGFSKILVLFAFFSIFNNIFVLHTAFADIRLMQIIFIPILYFACISALARFSEPLFEKSDIYLIFYLVIVFLSMFYHDFNMKIIKEWIQWLYLFILFFVLRAYISKSENLKFVYEALKIILLFVVLYGLAQIIFFNSEILFSTFKFSWLLGTSDARGERMDLFMLGPVATACVVTTLLHLYLFTEYKKKGYDLFIIIGLIIIILCTKSRASVAINCLLGILFLYKKTNKPHLRAIFNAFWACLGIAIIIFTIDSFIHMFANDRSFKYHYAVWYSSISMFLDNFFIGSGSGLFFENLLRYSYFKEMGVYNVDIDPHNIVLKLLAENGILGLLTFVLFFKSLLFYENSWQPNLVATSYSVASLIFMNMTMNMFMVEFFWVIMAIHCSQINVNNSKSVKSC